MPNPTPGQWRKKPVVIEAMQIDSQDYDGMCEIVGWCGGVAIDSATTEYMDGNHVIAIDTLEGRMFADPGDWIIRGVQGEFYPCKPEIFDATYEPASDPTPGQHDDLLVRADDAATVAVNGPLLADLAAALRAQTAETDRLGRALTDMAYGYLRIQESDRHSAFAARAFKAARKLVDIDTSKSWVSERELAELAEAHAETDRLVCRVQELHDRLPDDLTEYGTGKRDGFREVLEFAAESGLAEARHDASGEAHADNLQIIRDHHDAVTALADAGRKALDTSRVHVEVIERLERQLAEARAEIDRLRSQNTAGPCSGGPLDVSAAHKPGEMMRSIWPAPVEGRTVAMDGDDPVWNAAAPTGHWDVGRSQEIHGHQPEDPADIDEYDNGWCVWDYDEDDPPIIDGLSKPIAELLADALTCRDRALAAVPQPLWRGETTTSHLTVTDDGWRADASLVASPVLDVPPGTEVAVYKIEGGGTEAPCVPGSPSDASKATTVAAPTPEPLWTGAIGQLAAALLGSPPRERGINPETRVVVLRADQLPAGVGREQLAEAIANVPNGLGHAEGVIDAVMALLHGEGSE